MKRLNPIRGACCVAVICVTWAGTVHGQSIEDLVSRADTVVIGTVTARIESQTGVSFDINVERVLKGSAQVLAHVVHDREWKGFGPPPPQRPITGPIRGVWFLRSIPSTGWDALVTRSGWEFTMSGLYLPATVGPPTQIYPHSPDLPALDLITYEVAAALDMSGSTRGMAAAIGFSTGPAAQVVLAHWSASPDPALQITALALRLGNGWPGAIDELGTKRVLVEQGENWRGPANALRSYFRDPSPGPITRLSVIASAATGELRSAAVWALSAIHTREALPFLASLLESSNPTERARGVWGLSSFANGCPVQTWDNLTSMEYLQFKNPSTYRTRETIANFAGAGPLRISFWRGWWAEHGELH